jgi:hypothetical protein
MLNHHIIRRTLTGGLVIAAAGFPSAALAMRAENPPLPSSPTPVVVAPASGSSGQSSFQWSDAGIGAAGAVVLLSAGAAGVAVTRRRRMRPTAIS